jgi:hypothetical protein
MATVALPAQSAVPVVEESGVPELATNLPDWEKVLDKATVTNKNETLVSIIGRHEVLELIEFTGGTEAVTAPYPEGRLLIVEYPTPQASAAADAAFTGRLATSPGQPAIVYRRIGNYNAFVFDAADPQAAALLLDRITYEKTVQWLGKDPNYFQKAERYIARTTADLFLSTVVLIVIGLSAAVLTGIVVGLIFFRAREQQRARRAAYSDAGGLVRLNLDELTSPIGGDRLLSE